MYKFFIALGFLLFISKYSISQSRVDFQIGYGYLEHFSTGVGLKIKENHKISFILGSNFFMNLNKFAAYQLQYEYPNLFKRKLLLNFGLKGGYSIYSNRYNKWELLSVTPISNLKYRLKDNLSFVTTLGLTYSKILKEERLEMGEIGWYREFLPEIKIALLYDFKY